MHVFRCIFLEQGMQRFLFAAAVNAFFRKSFAVCAKRFERQRLSAILFRYLARPPSISHTLPHGCKPAPAMAARLGRKKHRR